MTEPTVDNAALDNAGPDSPRPRGRGAKVLDWIEWLGNTLPDPTVLFVIALLVTWGASWWFSRISFDEIDPRSLVQVSGEEAPVPRNIAIRNQLTGASLAEFLSRMVLNFTEFPPLGVVLVAMMGVGVAEHVGMIGALIKWIMSFTSPRFLTPVLMFVAILSHVGGDAGYVLVIPLGGVLFATANRHPLAGIAAAFAGVAGAFSASFIPSSVDPLLQSFTQSAAQMIAPGLKVNPLCNWWFMIASSGLLVLVGWFITDFLVEPRLKYVKIDLAPNELPRLESLSIRERRALMASLAMLLALIVLLIFICWPAASPLRDPIQHRLTSHEAPLMRAIVPLIFLMFFVPAVVYGLLAGTIRSDKDVVTAMSKSMSSMGYYMVLAFFAAQFTYAFRESNIGPLLAIKGAKLLASWNLPIPVTIAGIIILSVLVDLLVGSASAKWAIMAPIFLPMLMQVGISPELTQAAYRVGDSTTNIITPLLPYFALVVMFCQRYVKSTGIGTLVSLMLPYNIIFMITWTGLLIAFWLFNIPLGIEATYTYP